MVAFAKSFAPEKTAADEKNRVGDFFGEDRNRVGENASQVVDRVRVILVLPVRPRRGPSLARSGQGIDELDKANILASDAAFNLEGAAREKYWIIAEDIDPETGQKTYVRSDIVIGTSTDGFSILERDRTRATNSLPFRLRKKGVSDGHTHPFNQGISKSDLGLARENARFGLRSYLGLPNGTIYRINTNAKPGLFDRFKVWPFQRKIYQVPVRGNKQY